MKNLILFILLFFILNNSFFCQSSIGFNAGYAQLKMEDVNNDLNVNAANPFIENNNISGSLFFEGNFKYTLTPLSFGFSGNYVSSSGSVVSTSGGIKLYEENYNVSGIEILGLLETAYVFQESPLKIFIQLAGGIGLASIEHSQYVAPVNVGQPGNESTNDYDKNYFAGRFKGGLQYVFNHFIFELSLGYRFANAGKIEINSNLPPPNSAQGLDSSYQVDFEELEFDYSGILISAGVSFLL